MFEPNMAKAGVTLLGTFLIFALGKSPVFRIDRAGAAIIAAALTVATGVLTFEQATRTVDYRTIVLLFSMMIVAASLRISGFFRLLGNYLLASVETPKQLLLAVVLTSGLLSAFFINDVICLLFTPVVLLLCQRTGLNPLPFLMGVATASNIGSAGTLIGNPQNILIGSLSGMSFGSYMLVAFPLALVGLGINYLWVAWLYRADLTGNIDQRRPLPGTYHSYLVTKSLLVTLLILAGFLSGLDTVVVASLGAAYLLITRRLKPEKIYTQIDFNLLVIFTGLFVVIGGVEHSGLMAWLMERLSFIDFSQFSIFALLTVVLSNIFSNVPAVLLLQYFVPSAGDLWWSGLAVFSTLAGNLTLTGSIANLIVVEIAKKEGVQVSFLDYLKVGLPLTLITCTLALGYFAWLQ